MKNVINEHITCGSGCGHERTYPIYIMGKCTCDCIKKGIEG